MNTSIANILPGQPSVASTGAGSLASSSSPHGDGHFSDKLSKAKAQTQEATPKPPAKKDDPAVKPKKPSAKAPEKSPPAKAAKDAVKPQGGPNSRKNFIPVNTSPADPHANDQTDTNPAKANAPKLKLTQSQPADASQTQDPSQNHNLAIDKTKVAPAAAPQVNANDLAATAAAQIAAAATTMKQAAPPAPTQVDPGNANSGGLAAAPSTDLQVNAPSTAGPNAQDANANSAAPATASADGSAATDAHGGASAATPDKSHGVARFDDALSQMTQALDQQSGIAAQHASQNSTAPTAPGASPLPPDVQFAQENHAHIVSSIHSELLPGGGTMQIRLDPPELGALQVSVKMQDGVLSATFQTSNDEATHALSHSLSQLKTALESQGVTVQRLHVQQAPKQENSGNSANQNDRDSRQSNSEQGTAQQEQQRKEMVRRMWAKLAGGRDPLDLVA